MGILTQQVNTQIVAAGVEEVVAGVSKGGGDVLLRVGVALLPDPAFRRVAFGSVPGVDAFALDLVFRVDYALCEACNCRAGFEGRSRGVSAQQGAVEEWRVGLGQQLAVFLNNRGDIVCGVAGDSQWLPGLHIYHHGCPAGDLVLQIRVIVTAGNAFGALRGAVSPHIFNAVGENSLRLLLQHTVYGEINVVAGLRVLGVDGGENRAGDVSRLLHFPVLAVQLRLKGVFYAVLAHIGVVGIFQKVVFFIFLLGHQSHVAQQMGRILRVVVAHIGSRHFNAGQLVLHNGGDQPHAGILHENIVSRVDGVAHVDGIAHARNQPHLLGGVAVVNLIAGAHIGHQLHSGGVGRQGVTLVLEVGFEHGALDFRHVRVILEGRLHGNRQVVGIVIPIPAHHFHQIQDNTVGVLTGKKLGDINFNVVGFLVAHKNAPVPVQNVASRCGYGFRLLDQLIAPVIILLAFYNLQLVQLNQENGQNQKENNQQCGNPAGFHKFIHSLKTSVPGASADPPRGREVGQNRRRH